MTDLRPAIVVGVLPDVPVEVVEAAATFAERFATDLAFAMVDVSHTTVRPGPDGSVVAAPIDPEVGDVRVEPFDHATRDTIAAVLENRPVRWSVRELAGGAAQQLTRLADELDAPMIIVGTHQAGLRGSLHEWFNGSVAAKLAHHQHRPVVVIPLEAVGIDDD